jgi:hypothetical protein
MRPLFLIALNATNDEKALMKEVIRRWDEE